MRVLIIGVQTDIGLKLLESLDSDVEIYAVKLKCDLYNNETRLKINASRANVHLIEYRAYNMELPEVEYIVNCNVAPLPLLYNERPTKSIYTAMNSVLAMAISKFDGYYINLSSFHVYGNSMNAMPLEEKESRLIIKPPSKNMDTMSEDRFGYKSKWGIAEKMTYAPKDVSLYCLNSLFGEALVKKIKSPNVSFRLPYLTCNSVNLSKLTKYSDRINKALFALSKGQDIQITSDGTELSVYDVITPTVVAKFISDLIHNGDIITGVFNLSGVDCSELELVSKLQDFSIKAEVLSNEKQTYIPIKYYKADDRKLRLALSDKLTNLPKLTIQGLIMDYLDNSE